MPLTQLMKINEHNLHELDLPGIPNVCFQKIFLQSQDSYYHLSQSII